MIALCPPSMRPRRAVRRVNRNHWLLLASLVPAVSRMAWHTVRDNQAGRVQAEDTVITLCMGVAFTLNDRIGEDV
jgi:hypothetical protein